MIRRLPLVAVVVLTAVALALALRLRLSSDLLALLPDDRPSHAFADFARAFGGGDAAIVLLEGSEPEDVEAARDLVRARLAMATDVIESVIDRIDAPEVPRAMDAWSYAGPAGRRRLSAALTEEGMRRRLATTRAMLLAPGSVGLVSVVAEDPLRLASIPFEGREAAASIGLGDLATDDKRARLVFCRPRGVAFDHDAAFRFVSVAQTIIDEASRAHPRVSISLAGGHATAVATEAMLKGDLARSSALSVMLAALAFVVTFRRVRALLAVLPPLICGTAWTVAIAAQLASPLSAISLAFVSVVVGVGVDSGTHVYAALLRARARGLSPSSAAASARAEAFGPVMLAALAAGTTFATLSLSGLRALTEFGLLAGAGEVLTAVAILIVTPEIAARLERGSASAKPGLLPRWPSTIFQRFRSSAVRGAIVGIAVATILAAVCFARPSVGGALVLLRPSTIAPVVVQERIQILFGGRKASSQSIVLIRDANPERARERADALFEVLDELRDAGDVAGFDSLSAWSPSPKVKDARRVAARTIDFERAADALTKALDEAGFDGEAMAPAVLALRRGPASALGRSSTLSPELSDWIDGRYVALAPGDDTMIATFVRATGDPVRDERARTMLAAADAHAVITGSAAVEASLAATLGHGLPRVLLAALGVVSVALFLGLRRTRALAAVLFALAFQTALLLLAMRMAGIRWHVYDAMIVPVLLGITLDEVLFVERSSREAGDDGLALEAPLVTSTALTSAMGFVALFACRFTGLRDLAFVGAIGSVAGLLAAVFVVPAFLGVRGTAGIAG